jgi:hypothetical protein
MAMGRESFARLLERCAVRCDLFFYYFFSDGNDLKELLELL